MNKKNISMFLGGMVLFVWFMLPIVCYSGTCMNTELMGGGLKNLSYLIPLAGIAMLVLAWLEKYYKEQLIAASLGLLASAMLYGHYAGSREMGSPYGSPAEVVSPYFLMVLFTISFIISAISVRREKLLVNSDRSN